MSSAAAVNAGFATGRSRWSNLKLLLLVLEGYAYLFLIVAAFAAFVALLLWGMVQRQPLVALVTLFVGLPAVLVTASAIRALAFRLPYSEGIELTRYSAPKLFALIDDVAKEIGCPSVQRVSIDTAMNASALQVGRVGVFSPVNALRLGYPLLIALSAGQLRAVVAHELAHLFHAHSMVAGLVFRTRLSWSRLAHALAERQTVPIFVHWLFAAYLPRLETHSAGISREQEFLADEYAAAVGGSRVAVDALVAIDLGNRLLQEKFWPGLWADVGARAEPPRPFAEMRSTQVRLADECERRAILDELLKDLAGAQDTHPSLAQRIHALGEPPRVPSPPKASAGEAVLGPLLDRIAAELDERWERAHGNDWREQHARIHKARMRLAELEAEGDQTALNMLGRGEALEEAGQRIAALAMYRQALAADGNLAAAALAAGRLCLAEGQEEGAALLEHAMDADPNLVPAAADLLIDYYEESGRLIECHGVRTRLTQHRSRAAIAEAERNSLSALDSFAPHALPSEQVSALAATLQRLEGVDQAYLTVKKLRHSPGDLLVLSLVAQRTGDAALPDKISSAGHLPAGAHIVVLKRGDEALRHALESLPRACIYGGFLA